MNDQIKQRIALVQAIARKVDPEQMDLLKEQKAGYWQWASARDAALHLSTADIPEQVALEWLAALSVLARWIDNAQAVPEPGSVV